MAKISINDYLFTFRNFLSRINGNNVVLAGVNALKLHGLKMSREANDLDVVIFNPTEKQMSFLRDVSMLSSSNKNGNFWRDPSGCEKIQDENYPLDNIILKFKKDDLNLDVILEQSPTPSGLLFHRIYVDEHSYYETTEGREHFTSLRKLEFKIQNIALNIEAKNSYAVRNQDGLKHYRRIKDAIDLQDLKNSNFNL